MKIIRSVYDVLLCNTPHAPPETGGILGGTGKIVTHFQFDHTSNIKSGSLKYFPDTHYLNAIISKWERSNITFFGMFHSHRLNDRQLSVNDKKYITTIMLEMPPHLNMLYFPIILPQNTILAYRADRCGSDVHIIRDKIEIIKLEENSK